MQLMYYVQLQVPRGPPRYVQSCAANAPPQILNASSRAGGKKILVNMSGKDATDKFHQFHSRSILEKQAVKYKVGSLEGSEPAPVQKAAEAVEEEVEEAEDDTYFGDLVP